jgi:hypothetical protein
MCRKSIPASKIEVSWVFGDSCSTLSFYLVSTRFVAPMAIYIHLENMTVSPCLDIASLSIGAYTCENHSRTVSALPFPPLCCDP